MDIARTPATPRESLGGNPEMADAAVAPAAAPEIHRKDYRAFAWAVPTIHLDFALGLEETVVTAALQVTRNPAAEPSATLRLNGDGLDLVSLAIDGEPCDSHAMDGDDLLVSLPGETHSLTIVTRVRPAENSQLMGLYASNGMLCTQCEAEGFRRITFFPDRPDVLSTYSVRMSGPRAAFPVLLSNGDRVGSGRDGEDHWAEWRDPWPKPSYLFALVAGDLVARRDSFTTMSGREVDLAVWVREEDLGRTGHAMESLKKAMKWDEEAFGREYDLGEFNIVAVGDFNMGAMENKGLNVFNTKYVLADPETATDGDYDAIEGVIGHEYFHNWSGNRVTCRDWFQLSLKEGLTVLRDQLFSQDMGSPAVKRIEDVRVLRSVQFPEDSGPLAHPIRPDSYREISNFYTPTVYNKGAEVIRMMRTMAGPERFRAGTDLYFARHDGEAATCEDFVRAIEEGAKLDLARFRLWYSQAGTPRVKAELVTQGGKTRLKLAQEVPATPGQSAKQPMPIPLRVALHDRARNARGEERLVVLEEESGSFDLGPAAAEPALSLNRGFSAPVAIERKADSAELAYLARHDDDPFARYEAMQDLVVAHLVGAAGGGQSEADRRAGETAIAEAMGAILEDAGLDDLMRGELMLLPSLTYLMEQVLLADPGVFFTVREATKRFIGISLRGPLEALHARASAERFAMDAAAKGARKVRTLALTYLAAADPARAAELAKNQYDSADNMTDRQGALMVLTGLDGAERTAALRDFYTRFQGNALVIDKWFALQASSLHAEVLTHVKSLAGHPDFTLKNPNRARSLYLPFTGTVQGFHAASGEGYRLIADLILALDPLNAQTAARFVPALGRWRRIEPGRAGLMRAELERIAAADRLSRDTYEQVARSLG